MSHDAPTLPSDSVLAACHPRVRSLLTTRQDITQQTPEWFSIRRKMVTASDVAGILGSNPYTTRKSIMRRKLGTLNGSSANACTRHGQEYESMAGDVYSKLTGRPTFVYGLMPHRHFPWLGASPDLITADGRLVEIKCPVVSAPAGLDGVAHGLASAQVVIAEIRGNALGLCNLGSEASTSSLCLGIRRDAPL